MTHESRELILVVDDNELGLYHKSRTLRNAGYTILEARSGGDALRLIREQKPRLVLLDVKLPDLSGWEVCRRIKSDPETASVLVLQCSATFVAEEDTVRSLEGGADASLTEPLQPAVLLATVRALLRARVAEDALREALAREQRAREDAEDARVAVEAANRTKDEFLARLSHELRSPLGIILTWATLLRSGEVDEGQLERGLEVIERNTRLQASLIDDLLDLSRILSGKMHLERDLVDLATVIQNVMDSIRPAAEAKSIRIRSAVEPGVRPCWGDPHRIQQVVWNLLSNAMKFTPEGGRVDVSASGTGDHVSITVTDTGIGLEPESASRIFEPFQQVAGPSPARSGGLGLGLAIVRHIVELHGGRVEASSPGLRRGTTFRVTLPCALPGATANGVRGRDASSTLAGVHVLTVEDDPEALEAVGAVLRRFGASVESAVSVEDAFRVLQTSTPHVIVSDISMPGADGIALIRDVRGRGRHAGGDTPALALTARASAEDEHQILRAGYDAYLRKPVDAGELVSAVSDLVRSRDRV
ncbi:MAG TPA: response regulator [Candidatus Eisenbacteria bacterium]|nr:response regulator [Candidatus Eisenbacteria bacterium]